MRIISRQVFRKLLGRTDALTW